jgi:hypothetical protein
MNLGVFNRVNSNQKVCSVDDFPHYKLDPFAYKYFSKLRNICFERGKIRTGSASSFEKCWVHCVASNQTHNLSRFRTNIEMNIFLIIGGQNITRGKDVWWLVLLLLLGAKQSLPESICACHPSNIPWWSQTDCNYSSAANCSEYWHNSPYPCLQINHWKGSQLVYGGL